MLTDENAMYMTAYDMRCQIRCNFIIKQLVQKISALNEYEVTDCRIQDLIGYMSMNRPLLQTFQQQVAAFLTAIDEMMIYL